MQHVKCVVVGDGAVGKTSMLITCVTDVFPKEYVPSRFERTSVNMKLDEQSAVNLDLWDVISQTDFEAEWWGVNPYSETNVFLTLKVAKEIEADEYLECPDKRRFGRHFQQSRFSCQRSWMKQENVRFSNHNQHEHSHSFWRTLELLMTPVELLHVNEEKEKLHPRISNTTSIYEK
jgi:GTPase SAR1 family protein